MVKWVECTSAGTREEEQVYLNLHMATAIVPHSKGAVVMFAGGKQDTFLVKQKPDLLIEWAESGPDA